MSEFKHTPGPWRLEQDTTLVWGACNPDDTSDRGMGYPIAECRITPISHLWAKGPDVGEGEANARLIAAAPELLEALKLLISAMEVLSDGPDESDIFMGSEMIGRAAELGKLAVKKAEGR